MHTRIASVWLCMLCAILKIAGATTPDPVVLIRGAQSAREQIVPSHLVLETVFQSPINANTFRTVIDFDGELRRFERSNTSPTRVELVRSIFNGNEAWVYHKPYVSILNLSAEAPGSLYDPRILGVSGVMTWSMTIQKAFSQEPDSKLETLGQEDIEGASTWHVRQTDTNGTIYEWWIDVAQGFRVLRYGEKWTAGSRIIKSWYQNAEYTWLPSRVLFEEFGLNGGLTAQTEMRLLNAVANVAFPKTTWTVEGLDLPLMTQIVDRRSNTVVGYWTGDRIMSEAERNRQPERGLRPIPRSPRRIVLLTVFLIVLISPVFLLLRRKKQ